MKQLATSRRHATVLGRAIVRAIEDKNIKSLSDAAEQIGVPVSTLHNWIYLPVARRPHTVNGAKLRSFLGSTDDELRALLNLSNRVEEELDNVFGQRDPAEALAERAAQLATSLRKSTLKTGALSAIEVALATAELAVSRAGGASTSPLPTLPGPFKIR